jgi:hypothetical protein
MTWLGLKKLAFVPLSRTDAQPPDHVPPDWVDQIKQRVFFDPARDPSGQPIPGTDRSVRAYIQTVSSGSADLDVAVLLPETIEGQDIRPWDLPRFQLLGLLLQASRFDGAAVVMLGGRAPLESHRRGRVISSVIHCEHNIEELSCQPVEIDRPLHKNSRLPRWAGPAPIISEREKRLALRSWETLRRVDAAPSRNVTVGIRATQ